LGTVPDRPHFGENRLELPVEPAFARLVLRSGIGVRRGVDSFLGRRRLPLGNAWVDVREAHIRVRNPSLHDPRKVVQVALGNRTEVPTHAESVQRAAERGPGNLESVTAFAVLQFYPGVTLPILEEAEPSVRDEVPVQLVRWGTSHRPDRGSPLRDRRAAQVADPHLIVHDPSSSPEHRSGP